MEKLQNRHYLVPQDSSPARKPLTQERDLSCECEYALLGRPFGSLRQLGGGFVDLGLIDVVSSGFSTSYALNHVVPVFIAHENAAQALKVLVRVRRA